MSPGAYVLTPSYGELQLASTRILSTQWVPLLPTPASRRNGYSVQWRLFVCLSVCPRSKTKSNTACTINIKLCTRIFYSSHAASIDPEVKKSKVKVTRLRKPSRSRGCYSDACSYGRVLLLLPA